MAKQKSYVLKCKNPKCGHEFHRYWPKEEYDQLTFRDNGTYKGIGCFDCGFPKMAVALSNRTVKDGFKAGFQRNIMKYCATYEEYKAHLKNMGLIEIGYEKTEDDPHGEPVFNEKLIEKVSKRHGINLSPLEWQGINHEAEIAIKEQA